MVVPARYSSTEQRRAAYEQGRVNRWELERTNIDHIAAMICHELSTSTRQETTSIKYADRLIADYQRVHGPAFLPGYIRGAPDLMLQMSTRTLYAEIKILTVPTWNTRRGSLSLPCYGCVAYPLDEYVYHHMLDYARTYKTALHDILLVFAVFPSRWSLRCICLDTLKEHIDKERYARGYYGVNGPKLLIRDDDLSLISSLDIRL